MDTLKKKKKKKKKKWGNKGGMLNKLKYSSSYLVEASKFDAIGTIYFKQGTKSLSTQMWTRKTSLH